MTRAPDAKVCFLRESIENAPRPAELLQLLRLVSLCYPLTLHFLFRNARCWDLGYLTRNRPFAVSVFCTGKQSSTSFVCPRAQFALLQSVVLHHVTANCKGAYWNFQVPLVYKLCIYSSRGVVLLSYCTIATALLLILQVSRYASVKIIPQNQGDLQGCW